MSNVNQFHTSSVHHPSAHFAAGRDRTNPSHYSTFTQRRREKYVNCALRTLLLLVLSGFLITCALVAHAAPAKAPDADEILKRSDTYRNGWPAFVTHVKIQLRVRQARRRRALRGLAKGHRQNLRGVHEPARQRPPPAYARRRYVGLPARHQPPRAHHTARTALG